MNPGLKKSRGRALLPVAIALGVSLLLSGCYTLLTHPRSAGEEAVSGGGDCLQCHVEDDFRSTSYAPWVGYYAYSTSPWINYYGSPWWYDDYWVHCPECTGTEGAAAAEQPGRQAWVRRPRGGAFAWPDSTRIRNPLVVPAPIISATPSPAPAVGSQQSSSGSTPAQNSDDEKEKQKPKRRSIRR